MILAYEAAKATSLLLAMGTPLHEEKVTPKIWRSWYGVIRREMQKVADQSAAPNPEYDAWVVLP